MIHSSTVMSAPAASSSNCNTPSPSDRIASPLLDLHVTQILGRTVAEIQSSRQLLSTIRYTEHPSYDLAEYLSDVLYEDSEAPIGIMNYSQLYESLSAEFHESSSILPSLVELRNGDCIQTQDYRGIGKYFVLWLACPPNQIPVVWHTDECIQSFIQRTTQAAKTHENKIDSHAFWKATHPRSKENDDEEEGNGNGEENEAAATTAADQVDQAEPVDDDESPSSFAMPVLVSREADIPLRPDYHCYLFACAMAEHDEYGYSPPYALSNVSTEYGGNGTSDFDARVIDPCLTHPLSEYGLKITHDQTQRDEYKNDKRFPFQYLGFYDENQDEIEWSRLPAQKKKAKDTEHDQVNENEDDEDDEDEEEEEDDDEMEDDDDDDDDECGYTIPHIRFTRLLFAQHFEYVRLRVNNLS